MKLFQILTLFAITGCLYKSTEHEYTMKNNVKVLWFDNAPKYTYSAKIVVKGKMDCSDTISVITRIDDEKDYNIFGSSIESLIYESSLSLKCDTFATENTTSTICFYYENTIHITNLIIPSNFLSRNRIYRIL